MAPSGKRKRTNPHPAPAPAASVRALTPTSSSSASNQPESAVQTPIADCPFNVEFRQGKVGKKRRKPAVATDAKVPPDDLNTVYIVRPEERWRGLRRYRSCTVGSEQFGPGDYVYINNENIPHGTELTKVDESKFWIARILEVKAADEFHVYLRIYWMYRPEDLEGGKQWYHGANEVVNSNHMDVVDAMTVIGRAQVGHWLEKDEEEELPMLYWRQIYDYMSKTVGEVRKHCRCQRYYNPDRKLYGCSNPTCGKWLHEECLIEEVKKKVLERGGGPPPATEEVDNGDESSVKAAPKRKGGTRARLNSFVHETAKKDTPATATPNGKSGKKRMKKEMLSELDKIEVTFVDGDRARAHVRDLRNSKAAAGKKKREGEAGGIQEWDEDLGCLVCGARLD